MNLLEFESVWIQMQGCSVTARKSEDEKIKEEEFKSKV